MGNTHANGGAKELSPMHKQGVQPCVWAVGSGKGGVGKSVVTSNLAAAVAERGQRCVVLDADLGAANLHTMLGVPNPRWTLSHFLSHERASLSEVMCPTPTPNLWLISGARGLLDIANLKHSQKERLLRQIGELRIDHVFIDVSAGSAFNALDFFLAAQRGILVVVPEPTSIENSYYFLKAAFFRSLRKAARRSSVRAAIERVLDESARQRIGSPRELIARVLEIDFSAGMLLYQQAMAFSPMLIVNQARAMGHRSLGHKISVACKDYLGTGIDYLGALGWDEFVRDSVREREPVVRRYPGSPFALDLEIVVDRLLSDQKREAHKSEEIAARHRHESNLFDERYFATHGELVDQGHVSPPEPTPAAHTEACSETGGLEQDKPDVSGESRPPGISQPGAHLRYHRQKLGLKLNELSQRTRILSLESIEHERFEQLPPEPYVRGFILQYAQVLGINEAESLAVSFMERYRQAVEASG